MDQVGSLEHRIGPAVPGKSPEGLTYGADPVSRPSGSDSTASTTSIGAWWLNLAWKMGRWLGQERQPAACSLAWSSARARYCARPFSCHLDDVRAAAAARSNHASRADAAARRLNCIARLCVRGICSPYNLLFGSSDRA